MFIFLRKKPTSVLILTSFMLFGCGGGGHYSGDQKTYVDALSKYWMSYASAFKKNIQGKTRDANQIKQDMQTQIKEDLGIVYNEKPAVLPLKVENWTCWVYKSFDEGNPPICRIILDEGPIFGVSHNVVPYVLELGKTSTTFQEHEAVKRKNPQIQNGDKLSISGAKVWSTPNTLFVEKLKWEVVASDAVEKKVVDGKEKWVIK